MCVCKARFEALQVDFTIIFTWTESSCCLEASCKHMNIRILCSDTMISVFLNYCVIFNISKTVRWKKLLTKSIKRGNARLFLLRHFTVSWFPVNVFVIVQVNGTAPLSGKAAPEPAAQPATHSSEQERPPTVTGKMTSRYF